MHAIISEPAATEEMSAVDARALLERFFSQLSLVCPEPVARHAGEVLFRVGEGSGRGWGGRWLVGGPLPGQGPYGRSVPANTCQARIVLANRLSSMYARSPYR